MRIGSSQDRGCLLVEKFEKELTIMMDDGKWKMLILMMMMMMMIIESKMYVGRY